MATERSLTIQVLGNGRMVKKVIAITFDDDYVMESEILSLTSTTLKVNAGKIQFDTNGDGIDDDEVSILYTLTAK